MASPLAFERLIADFPTVPYYRHALAGFLTTRAYALQMNAGTMEEAIALSRRVILLKPDFAHGHRVLGHALRKKGALDEAVAAYREAIRLEPVNVIGHSHLGLTLSMQGAWDEAIAAYREAIRCTPDDVLSLSMLAAALTKTGAAEEAAATYEQLLKIKPDSALHCNNLAWLLANCAETKFRNPAQAVELARKAVELDPQSGSSWNTLGAAQYRAGDWKGAIASLNKSQQLAVEAARAYDGFFLAMAHWQLGDKDEARRWHDKAVEWMDKNAKDNEELLRFRAEAAALLGKPS